MSEKAFSRVIGQVRNAEAYCEELQHELYKCQLMLNELYHAAMDVLGKWELSKPDKFGRTRRTKEHVEHSLQELDKVCCSTQMTDYCEHLTYDLGKEAILEIAARDPSKWNEGERKVMSLMRTTIERWKQEGAK